MACTIEDQALPFPSGSGSRPLSLFPEGAVMPASRWLDAAGLSADLGRFTAAGQGRRGLRWMTPPDVINKCPGDNEGILMPFGRPPAWMFLRPMPWRCSNVVRPRSQNVSWMIRGAELPCIHVKASPGSSLYRQSTTQTGPQRKKKKKARVAQEGKGKKEG